jgi:hypothetical protein
LLLAHFAYRQQLKITVSLNNKSLKTTGNCQTTKRYCCALYRPSTQLDSSLFLFFFLFRDLFFSKILLSHPRVEMIVNRNSSIEFDSP